jgi:peptidoglycan/LPS O-acetylase OafA/YrhL
VLTGLGLALAAGLIYLLIDVATGGQWTVSIIRANINAFDLNQAVSFYKQWAGLHLLILVVALARLVYETYPGRLTIYGVWFAAALINGVLSGKFGAGESYFVTATAAACALSGLALARLWAGRRVGRERPLRRWGAGLLAAALPGADAADAAPADHRPGVWPGGAAAGRGERERLL